MAVTFKNILAAVGASISQVKEPVKQGTQEEPPEIVVQLPGNEATINVDTNTGALLINGRFITGWDMDEHFKKIENVYMHFKLVAHDPTQPLTLIPASDKLINKHLFNDPQGSLIEVADTQKIKVDLSRLDKNGLGTSQDTLAKFVEQIGTSRKNGNVNTLTLPPQADHATPEYLFPSTKYQLLPLEAAMKAAHVENLSTNPSDDDPKTKIFRSIRNKQEEDYLRNGLHTIADVAPEVIVKLRGNRAVIGIDQNNAYTVNGTPVAAHRSSYSPSLMSHEEGVYDKNNIYDYTKFKTEKFTLVPQNPDKSLTLVPDLSTPSIDNVPFHPHKGEDPTIRVRSKQVVVDFTNIKLKDMNLYHGPGDPDNLNLLHIPHFIEQIAAFRDSYVNDEASIRKPSIYVNGGAAQTTILMSHKAFDGAYKYDVDRQVKKIIDPLFVEVAYVDPLDELCKKNAEQYMREHHLTRDPIDDKLYEELKDPRATLAKLGINIGPNNILYDDVKMERTYGNVTIDFVDRNLHRSNIDSISIPNATYAGLTHYPIKEVTHFDALHLDSWLERNTPLLGLKEYDYSGKPPLVAMVTDDVGKSAADAVPQHLKNVIACASGTDHEHKGANPNPLLAQQIKHTHAKNTEAKR